MTKERMIRDPIHGFISLSHYTFIQELVDTKYFQRLRRIAQLGVSVYVYPSATHNRFNHVLGVMELFVRLFDNLFRNSTEKRENIEIKKKLGIATILLHDIGHGPFSHVSEDIFGIKHESIAKDIIVKTEIKDILDKWQIKGSDVIEIMDRTTVDYKIISQLISSQLDVDRLDYLARDSYFTGTGFGKIDLDRIIRMMEIFHSGGDMDGYAVTRNGGKYSIESYVLSRHLMYQGVYLHKATRCIQLLIEKLFTHAKCLAQENKIELPDEIGFLKGGKMKPEDLYKDLYMLDDHMMFSIISRWTKSPDSILRDYASRILNRKILKGIELQRKEYKKYTDNIKQIEKTLENANFDPSHYLLNDDPADLPYSPYLPKSPDDRTSVITNIFILDELNKPREISELSPVVKALSEYQDNFRVYVPVQCESATLNILGRTT